MTAGTIPRRTLPANSVFIQQGDRGDRAWQIESGQVEVLLETRQGVRRLAALGPGTVVGEMALIDGCPRSATVRTLTEVTCLELDRSAFQGLMDSCPPRARQVLGTLVSLVRRMYGLADGEEGAVVGASLDVGGGRDRRAFAAGETLFRQGDAGTVAYLICSGRVSLRRESARGTKELAWLGAGRLLGERCLLGPTVRPVSAVAVEDTVCELLDKDEFADMIAVMPPMIAAVARLYIQQIAAGL